MPSYAAQAARALESSLPAHTHVTVTAEHDIIIDADTVGLVRSQLIDVHGGSHAPFVRAVLQQAALPDGRARLAGDTAFHLAKSLDAITLAQERHRALTSGSLPDSLTAQFGDD